MIPFLGLTRDNNLRADTSLAKLGKLQPVFDRTSGHGTLTAGNSTPLTDGAAAILIASEKWADQHGQVPQAWLVDAETAAVDYFGPDPEGLLMAPPPSNSPSTVFKPAGGDEPWSPCAPPAVSAPRRYWSRRSIHRSRLRLAFALIHSSAGGGSC